jgi:hypothetical protein
VSVEILATTDVTISTGPRQRGTVEGDGAFVVHGGFTEPATRKVATSCLERPAVLADAFGTW